MHVISFGYTHGKPPKADHVADVRHDPYKPHEWTTHAKAIAKRVKGAKTVAIGDQHGQTRAPKIAAHVAKHFGATLMHRDKGKGKGTGLPRHEQIQALRYKGHSEEDAIRKASE
jgi:RNase adaptor protein for sRNA GlmZ degradation